MVQKYILIFIPEKLVNELHEWIEKQPNIIQSTNISDSMFVKFNGTLLKEDKLLPQISVRDLQNDIIFPVLKVDFMVLEMSTAEYVF